MSPASGGQRVLEHAWWVTSDPGDGLEDLRVLVTLDSDALGRIIGRLLRESGRVEMKIGPLRLAITDRRPKAAT